MNLIIDGNAFLNVAINIVKSILVKGGHGTEYYVKSLLNDGEFQLKAISKKH